MQMVPTFRGATAAQLFALIALLALLAPAIADAGDGALRGSGLGELGLIFPRRALESTAEREARARPEVRLRRRLEEEPDEDREEESSAQIATPKGPIASSPVTQTPRWRLWAH